MAGDADVRTATALLELMREPQARIAQVDEVCDFDGREYVRSISIEFNRSNSVSLTSGSRKQKKKTKSAIPPKSLPSFTPIFVDLVSPQKGDVLDLEVVSDPSRASRLSHDEHRGVSQFLIYFRSVQLLKSCTVGEAEADDFALQVTNALIALVNLPYLSPSEGLAVLNEFFGDDHVLRAVSSIPGAQFNKKKMSALYNLCEMFAERYLVLAEFQISSAADNTLRYQHRHAVDDRPEVSLTSDNRRPSRRWKRYREAFSIWANTKLRHFFGVPPISLRVPVPWAKRTDHYSLRVGAPDDYFFARHQILATPTMPQQRSAATQPSELVKWSRNLNAGRRAQAFISGGRFEVGKSLSVWHQIFELPGRSTLRVCVTAWIVGSVIAILGLIETFAANVPTDAPAFVVAVLSLVSLVVEQSLPSRGSHGPPIISRVTPIALSVGSLTFAAWLIAKHDAVAGLEKINPLAATCFELAWVPIALALLCAACVATRRHDNIRSNYKQVISRVIGVRNNMYVDQFDGKPHSGY